MGSGEFSPYEHPIYLSMDIVSRGAGRNKHQTQKQHYRQNGRTLHLIRPPHDGASCG
jgi:hypothetical protein